MSANSRTVKSIKNSTVALGFYFISLVTQFFSRKIFLDHLGAEVLGLNTTATNLLQFLNLAELGIGTAVAYTLYKPFFTHDTQTINEIVSLQGWMYRRIAYVVILAAGVLMCAFPWIFAKMPLPQWYAYASFIVLLVSALLSYFVNYKQVVLSADQKEYKIQYSYKSSMLIKVLCQIIAIKYFNNGYIWWLVLEVIFAVIAAVVLNYTICRTYPWLKTNIHSGRELRHKYSDITKKIKQLFFHKVAYFALTQTSQIIIYAYASLTLVAFYGNYMLIITGVTMLMGAMFNGVNGSIGNLVAEGDKKRNIAVFEELFSVRFLLTCIMCFGVYLLTPSFITLWIGSQYLMGDSTLLLMISIMYINLSRLTVDSYLNAYGLYQDIWAPLVEAIINVGLSIWLGYFWGLHGILWGVLISLLLIVFCWKPYFLFRNGLKIKLINYVLLYTKHILALLICISAVWYLQQLSYVDFTIAIMELVAYRIIIIIVFAIILFLLLYVTERGMRRFVKRFVRLIHR